MGLGSILGSVAQGALGLIGMGKQEDAYNSNMAFSREQFDYQKQLHQNQIQWRVSDAQKAGLHPMAALGLSSSSFSPVSTPSVPDFTSGYANLGDAAASLGQNIDSAIMAGKTKEERQAAQSLQRKAADISLQKGEAELEGIKLENDQKRWFLQQQMFPRPALARGSVIGGQADAKPSVPTGGYGSADALLDLARHGRTLLDVINPDIADSITESTFRSAIANVASEWENATGYVKPPVDFLTSEERRALAAGLITLKRYPGMWRIVDTPHKRNMDALRRYDTAHGRDAWHNPRSWKWLDKLGQKIKEFFD